MTSKHDPYLMRHSKINETFANITITVECVSYITMDLTNAKMSKIVYTLWVINKSKWTITHFENINFHFMSFCTHSLSISLDKPFKCLNVFAKHRKRAHSSANAKWLKNRAIISNADHIYIDIMLVRRACVSLYVFAYSFAHNAAENLLKHKDKSHHFSVACV